MKKATFEPEQKISIHNSLPEALDKTEAELPAVDESEGGHKSYRYGLSRKAGISILGLLVFVVFAAAGIGIGVGVTIKKTPSPSARTSTSTQTNVTRYARLASITSPLKLILNSTSSPTSQPSVVPKSSHLIRNDSSLAALTLYGGDRIVHFQDPMGIIWEIKYQLSANIWSLTPSPVVASGSRNFTPLALLHNPNTTDEAVISVHSRSWFWY